MALRHETPAQYPCQVLVIELELMQHRYTITGHDKKNSSSYLVISDRSFEIRTTQDLIGKKSKFQEICIDKFVPQHRPKKSRLE